jgi:SHS2 domain-containing protein
MKRRAASGGVRAFDHTADLGLAVSGETLEDLFVWAALGLTRVSLKGRRPGAAGWPPRASRPDGEAPGASPRTVESVPVSIPPRPDPEALLVAWLNHLIYLLETEGLVAVGGDLAINEATLDADSPAAVPGGGWPTPTGAGWTLSGSLKTFRIPPQEVRTGIKAATYHGLKISRRQGLFRARIILDI